MTFMFFVCLTVENHRATILDYAPGHHEQPSRKRTMRKSIQVVLYLTACTLVIFYGQRILSTLVRSGGEDPGTRAEAAHMTEDAYYSLREVASVQLGHVLITYIVDETSGRLLARYSNEACPNPQADPALLRKQLEDLQEELHVQILLIGPGADMDHSGFVTDKEGARFRGLFVFGHLAAHCREKGFTDLDKMALAAGLGTEETARNLQDYRELVAGYPAEVREFFLNP